MPGEDARSTSKSELQRPMMSKIDEEDGMRNFAAIWKERVENAGCIQFVAVLQWYL
jgi:hypothetical protein